MRVALLVALAALAGCEPAGGPDKDTADDGGAAEADADHDGYSAAEGDCADDDATTNPGAVEACDGADNDCDDEVDEGLTSPWYPDPDGDGWGSGAPVEACTAPTGHVAAAGDCSEDDTGVNPGAPEVCNAQDDDCDDEIDENVTSAWYADADGDGHGDATTLTWACDGASGLVDNGDDCDDTEATVYPDAPEVCDLLDNDCDDVVDEGVTTTFYADVDGDGHGEAGVEQPACSLPTGYSALDDDCDDDDAGAHPGADETCDGVDDDCDGEVDEDEAIDAPTWYADADGDGFGDAAAPSRACSAPGTAVADATDCDDGDAAEHPDALETCDGDDDDCDGDTDEDEAIDAPTWYADADGDGYGNAGFSTVACDQPALYVADATDCDDGEASNNPAGTEVCDGDDNDCDGDTDEADATDASTWYADLDGDHHGDSASPTTACDAPADHVATGGDCDDGDAGAYPGATELCDGDDDDCDGDVDESSAADAVTWYADADADGYGDAHVTTVACDLPSGYATVDDDCDDTDDTVHPGASEACDGEDDDCDGTTDEEVLGSGAACAAESCQAVLDAGASTGDGTYWLDPTGSGSASPWLCDMTTDGGGWTNIVYWDRYHDGDTSTDLAAELTVAANTMGRYTSGTTYLEWADYDANSDVLALQAPVTVPNGGEVLMDLYLYGYSMDDSGVYAYVTAGGSDQNLLCRSDLDFGSSTYYSSAERAYLPGYTCALDASTTWTWSGEDQYVVSGEVTAFELDSFMYDSYGDYVRFYNLVVWVR